MSEWIDINEREPEINQCIDLKLCCGSVLFNCCRSMLDGYEWYYGDYNSVFLYETGVIKCWRPHVEIPDS